METKTDMAKFISFHFRFFRFVSVFRNFFVSVNGITIFPLTDISISVNVNHTVQCSDFSPFCKYLIVVYYFLRPAIKI